MDDESINHMAKEPTQQNEASQELLTAGSATSLLRTTTKITQQEDDWNETQPEKLIGMLHHQRVSDNAVQTCRER